MPETKDDATPRGEVSGFKCDSCGRTFPKERDACYHCGSEYLTPIPEMGTAVGCELCGSTDLVEEHHTSYFPEKTMQVCTCCHNRIHRTDGFFDELQPDISRPDNYESALNNWKARNHPDKIQCVSCKSWFVVGNTYLLDEGSGELPSEGDRVRCYKCTGKKDSIRGSAV